MTGPAAAATAITPERLRALTQDRPDIPEILKTVGEFLDGVANRTSGSERYNALCATFLLKVVERELALSADAVARQWRDIQHLTGAEPSATEPYAAFCAAARAGRLDAQWDAAVAFALHQVIDKVRVTNPDHLDPRHRDPD